MKQILQVNVMRSARDSRTTVGNRSKSNSSMDGQFSGNDQDQGDLQAFWSK